MKKKISFIGRENIVDDNAFAICRLLLKQNKNYKYVWLVNIENQEQHDKRIRRYFDEKEYKKIKTIKRKSLMGLWHYYTSNYIFLTQGGFESLPHLKWQKKINLWHGMPFKKIEMFKNKLHMNKTVATSPLFNDIVSESFGIPKNKILNIGMPRSDFFYENNTELRKELCLNDNQKIYMWMPTFRDEQNGYSIDKIAGLEKKDYLKINEVLKNKNAILYIKLHPIDKLNFKKYSFEFSNIKILTNPDFLKLSCEVNHFLSLADVLITDYSSVYFDFALLNRPMILYTDDQENYQNYRGFTSEKLLDVMSESLKISTPEALVEALAEPIENLPILSREANNIINQYTLKILEKNSSITDEVIKALGL